MSQQHFDKYEWWDLCRSLNPALTWEEFETLWANRPTERPH